LKSFITAVSLAPILSACRQLFNAVALLRAAQVEGGAPSSFITGAGAAALKWFTEPEATAPAHGAEGYEGWAAATGVVIRSVPVGSTRIADTVHALVQNVDL
jgi:hypothetical protein